MQKINNRLAHLRNMMRVHNLSAYIVPGTDPHAGEYIADHWKERDWISGFDGSAGTVAVTLEKAGVWVDSRYYLQADEQLQGTAYETMKMGLPNVPDIIAWLKQQLKSGDQVGVNPEMFSVNAFAAMKEALGRKNINLVQLDLIREIWLDRPAVPENPIFIFDEKLSGKSSLEKIDALRQMMKNAQADVFVTNTLDEIAWLFNIRGSDVDYNPVAIAYASVSGQEAILYISQE